MTDQRKVTLAPHKGQSCLRDLPLLSIDKQDRTDRNGQKTSPPEPASPVPLFGKAKPLHTLRDGV